MKKIIGLFLFLISLEVSISAANAGISFSIDKEEIPKTKLLIYGFDIKNPAFKSDVEKILDGIKYNLESTNLFEISKKSGEANLIPAKDKSSNIPNAIPKATPNTEQIPDFDKYSEMGIGAMLVSDITVDALGNMEIKLRLWDILDERQLFGKYYSTGKAGYGKMSNVISNEIYKAISGEKSGHFDSQIAYVAESGTELKKIKRIAMMDFDGGNRKYLTSGSDLVLTPAISKKPGEIIFLRYAGNGAQLYKLNIKDKILKKLGNFSGTSFAPNVNPKDPNLILLSVIEGGSSNIYELNSLTGKTAKLTNNGSINTTPSYSPDGKRVVFSSDREGKEQIYIMNADGSSAKKLSSGDAMYSKPVWSPDGNLIAYTEMKSNKFGIGIMTADGRNEKILTRGYLVEGAKWSPNGRYLIYARKNSAYGKSSISKLYMIDIVTGFERELPTPENEGASDPDWANNW